MSVKRYDPTMNSEEYTGREYVSMCEDECGEYVKHTDYAALALELAEAREALRVYGRHLDSCGDADAFNHAEIPSSGCGFDAVMKEGER